MPTGFIYLANDVWGRRRDCSLWVDLPARLTAIGHELGDPGARRRIARGVLRELRDFGVEGLIVVRVNGMGGR